MKRICEFLINAAGWTLLFVCIAAFGIAAAASADAMMDGSAASFLPGLELAVLFLVFAVAVHELGHAIAAKLAGWDVHLFALFGIAYLPKRGLIGRGGGMGMVLATPPLGGEWRKGWARYVFGGPLANFAVAALAALSMVFLRPHLADVAGGIAATSALTGIAALAPIRRAGSASDGAKLLDVARGRPPGEATRALSWLTGQVCDGIAPGQWDPALIHVLESGQVEPGLREARSAMVATYYLAVGDIQHAHTFLERSESDGPDGCADLRAFAIALVERDAGRADKVLDRVPPRARSYSFWRARAAILALRGQYDEARKAVACARDAIRKQREQPVRYDLDLFDIIERGEPLPMAFERAQAA